MKEKKHSRLLLEIELAGRGLLKRKPMAENGCRFDVA